MLSPIEPHTECPRADDVEVNFSQADTETHESSCGLSFTVFIVLLFLIFFLRLNCSFLSLIKKKKTRNETKLS